MKKQNRINVLATFGAAVCVALAVVPSADAATISIAPGNVTASSEIPPAFNRLDDYLVDGSGLTGGAHTIAVEPNMWLSTGSGFGGVDTDPFVVFDLGAVYTINSFHVWNYNESPPNLTNRGVNAVTVQYGFTADTGSTVPGVTNFAQANGLATYTGENFAAFPAFNARFIKFDIDSNHGDGNSFYGLSEVQFDGTFFGPAPEPVAVPNFSFESGLSGWTAGGPVGTFGGAAGEILPDEGSAYAFFETGTAQPGTRTLTSASSLGTVLVGETYELLAAIGHRNFDGSGGRRPDDYMIELLLDGVTVASNSLSDAHTNIPATEWLDLVASFTATSSGELTIRLTHSSDDATFRQGAFDNIRLSVIPIPTPAALPAGLAMLGLIAVRRRR